MTDTLMQVRRWPPCRRCHHHHHHHLHHHSPPPPSDLQTDMGIMVNHAYTLLDVQKVGEDHTGAVKLLKLRNPWGQSEWKGPWSDDAEEWKTGIGRKAKELLDVQFGNDGTFWIAWEDFQSHFNKVRDAAAALAPPPPPHLHPLPLPRLTTRSSSRSTLQVYVCRVLDTVDGATVSPQRPPPAGHWCRYEVDGQWVAENAGGCFNFPQWRINPQYGPAHRTNIYEVAAAAAPPLTPSFPRYSSRYEIRTGARRTPSSSSCSTTPPRGGRRRQVRAVRDAHGGEEGGPKVRDPHTPSPQGHLPAAAHTALTPSLFNSTT